MEPTVDVKAHGQALWIDVTLDDDLSPGAMIGSRAAMRLCLTTIIGAATNMPPEAIKLHVNGADTFERRPSPTPRLPDPEPIQQLCQSVVDLVGGGTSKTEAGESSIMAIVTVPEQVKNRVRPSLLKIVRAAGKAHGFPAMAHVSAVETVTQ